jgi:hypothetical protein
LSKKTQILLITLACLAVYFTLRWLPVEECAFLHYGDYVNAEGVIEGCGYEETEFFDMTRIRYPIIAELTPLEDPEPGQLLTCSLTLFTTTGKPIQWEQIAVSHTERLHAMVVDPSLQDYQHVHPQPEGPAGHYIMEVTPRMAGEYAVYLDFIPLTTSRRTLLKCAFIVPGEPASLLAQTRLQSTVGGIDFSLILLSGELTTGTELTFRLGVKPGDGSPTLFAPVMDSYAHVVAFDAAGTGFAHLHPVNPLIKDQDPTSPDLRFTFKFDTPCHYRIWAQLEVNGHHLFIPFDLEIAEA